MTRISKAFQNKKAFIAFVTGGDPDIDDRGVDSADGGGRRRFN